MTISLADIASLTEAPNASVSRPLLRTPAIGVDRRAIIMGLAAAGAGLGLAVFGQLPVAREARAGHNCVSTSGQTSIYGGCPPGQAGYGCTGCGPSTVYGDVCGPNDYHRYSGNYRRRRNECYSGGWDGWTWFTGQGTCGCPSGCGRNFRCHDGCKYINGSWVHSICRPSTGCVCA